MDHTYTTEQIRAAETVALARDTDDRLMRRAAHAVAMTAVDLLPPPRPGRRVVLLVGTGNNGGDALFAGAVLRRRGMAVAAVLLDPARTHPRGLAALRRAGGRTLAADDDAVAALLADAELIVDGMVGLGARPPLRGAAAALAIRASACGAIRLAVDIPSGVDTDTGAHDGAVFTADVTVTIGGYKTGLLLTDHAGQVRLAEIGMAPADLAPQAGSDTIVLDDADAERFLPEPGPDDHKYTTGVVGIAAGSVRYPGAAVLATGAAVRTRPGLVRYLGPVGRDVLTRWPEVVAVPDLAAARPVDAWAIGSGWGTDGAAADLLAEVMEDAAPVLVDADGITILAERPELLAHRSRRGRTTVLTPHAGEFVRLLPDLDPADRLGATRAAAARTGAIVLLKGAVTVIADPTGPTFLTVGAPPWLATAGSGDVLTGLAGSLLAAAAVTGADPATAIAAAARLHGRAGRRAQRDRAAGASALWRYLR